MLLSDVCLSRTSDLTRTETPRKTKIGTEVVQSHLTRTSLSRSRSPGRFTQHSLNVWGRCSGDCENVLGVGNYCYVASVWRHVRRPRGGEGRGLIVSPRARLVLVIIIGSRHGSVVLPDYLHSIRSLMSMFYTTRWSCQVGHRTNIAVMLQKSNFSRVTDTMIGWGMLDVKRHLLLFIIISACLCCFHGCQFA